MFIKKLFFVLLGLAVLAGFLFLFFPPKTNIASLSEGITMLDKEGYESFSVSLSNQDLDLIKSAIKRAYCYLPFEACAISLRTEKRITNPDLLNNYSYIISGTFDISTPWPFFRDPTVASSGSFIIAKKKADNSWELVEKLCCCDACSEWR
ncbi:MAG: hypothetical protein PHN39_01410 [Candidatus Pacebacteria bacterium]|nr:hypothetical protein [Candidatus Paceibacterota bacterium]